MKLNRVVVTGYGLTSPIGNTPEEFWTSLKEGKIGIGPITKFDHSEFAVHNAAEVQDFPFDKYFIKKDTNRFDNYSLYALYAAEEAVNHAGLDVEAIDKDRFGVIVASGIGGIKEIEDQVIRLHEKGPKRVKPGSTPTKGKYYGTSFNARHDQRGRTLRTPNSLLEPTNETFHFWCS